MLTASISLLCRSGYPAAQPTRAKKARKHKNQGTATPTSESAAPQDSASLEEKLQLEEWGLPAAFGTSKASHRRQPSWLHESIDHAAVLEQTCLQGEVYEEDDSCAAIDHAELQQASIDAEGSHAAGMHAGVGSGHEWQQAFDSTTGYFYYYRESTQVCKALLWKLLHLCLGGLKPCIMPCTASQHQANVINLHGAR